MLAPTTNSKKKKSTMMTVVKVKCMAVVWERRVPRSKSRGWTASSGMVVVVSKS